MHAAFALLDKAIELGRLELAHLSAGDVDKAGELAFGRDDMLNQALSNENLAGPAEGDLDALMSRLLELKDLQAQIIDEASRLRQDVAAKLRRTGQEQKRHAGYGRSTRPVPRVQSRFISRNS
ncbi:MAG: hypothetical protein AUJ49_01960 [Desulfovibrionaceae bacterium CG1_02_65_16]|nr:MAG: hypothetical protein AUJ49_01960 [Desulfovibrionaceae bacterium CG1_02_65_16]